jgi:geranylgeranyl pyrophosphate synthase
VDQDWVAEMIRVEHRPSARHTRTFLHLMRAASKLFEPDELERIAVRRRGGPRLAEMNGQGLSGLDPIAVTEAMAYDFLSKGGKHSRPFTTLAVYDALSGTMGTSPDGPRHLAALPDAVKSVAISIETFHKASLVHDDIEDDDSFRYGDETIHRKYGIPAAINVGDYLIGLGYRLVSGQAASLGADVVADILHCLSEAHTRLCEGQGAELAWRDSRDKRLQPIDALKIYALKTAPAFEAALYCGARLAGPAEQYVPPLKQFARDLGVAFQIINDLDDWRGDDHNKMAAGGDALGGRPTVLWALALESLSAPDRAELLSLAAEGRSAQERLARVRELYEQAGVFERANRLIDKYQERAEAVADAIQSPALRRLFHYLIETVLERPAERPLELVDLLT